MTPATSNRRRKRFERSVPNHPLTAIKVQVVRCVGTLGIGTSLQVATMQNRSLEATRKHLFDLFHMGFVDRIGVPRAAMADSDAANDETLLYGSAPMIYVLTQDGAQLAGMPYRRIKVGPKNSLFLRHELQVSDGRVWLELLRRRYDCSVSLWQTGLSVGPARPDAAFVLDFTKARLTGLVEIDRSTEHSPKRWEEKHMHYSQVFSTGAIQQTLGQSRGRVILVTPDAKRRDAIADILRGRGWEDRFWLTEQSTLSEADLRAHVWRVPDKEALLPLVPEHVLEDSSGGFE